MISLFKNLIIYLEIIGGGVERGAVAPPPLQLLVSATGPSPIFMYSVIFNVSSSLISSSYLYEYSNIEH